MELSIIIVNYNSKDFLRQCIDSISVSTNGIKFEIIVIDSASFDGCGEMLRQFYPEVRFIQSNCNVGFARSNNIGTDIARGSVLLFLNPDTEMQEHAIARLYRKFQTLSDVGVAGCQLLNSDGSLQTSCVQPLPTVLNQALNAEVFQRWFPMVGLWNNATTFQDVTDPVEVEALSGACLMIHREVFDQVGGFCEDYFMYGEDIDLCYKTRLAGFRNYYVPEAVITHYGGGSSSRQTRSDFSHVMLHESVSRFLCKSRGNCYRTCYRITITGAAAIRLLFLAMFYPAFFIGGRFRGWKTAVWKWVAVLRWGIGLEKWTKSYDRLEMTAAGSICDGGNSCAASAEN